MDILSFITNQELAGFIISLAAQSILVSLIGIAAIRLLSRRSAPVRSLVCTATIAALGLMFVIFFGYRLYDADFTQYVPAGLDDREITERVMIPPPVREMSLPIEQLPVASFEPSTVESLPVVSSAPLPYSDNVVTDQPVSEPYSLSIPLKEQGIIFINALGLIWLLGALFQVLRLGYGLIVVRRFKGSLEAIKDISFNNMLSNIAATLFRKGRLIPRLYRSSLIESPMAIGFIHPAIIIPEKLFSTLTDNELKSILLHETAHIYHYDHVTGIIKRFVIAFHWWNPFVYIINKEHEQAREEVSDNYVLNELSPGDYSRCLMNLAEKVSLISNIPFASGMADKGFNLIKRVEQILSKKRSNAMNTRLSFKIIVFVCLAVLTFSIAGIHARVSEVKNDDNVREIQEPKPASNPVSITKEDQNITDKNVVKEGAVDEQDMSKPILNTETTPQKELSDKQVQENKEPVMVMASVDTKNMNKIEKPIDIVDVQSSDETALIKDQADNTVLAQNETSEGQELKATTVLENVTQNDMPKETLNDSKKEDIDTAIADFSRQIEMNDSDSGLYLLRGNLHMDKQDYEKAVNDYTKAIKINPDDAAAYNNRGQAYTSIGETKQAIKDFKKAIKVDPKNIFAYINRGNAYYSRQSYRRAISDYTRAIEIDPEFSLAYINRGIAYQQNNSLSKAINDFSKALELDGRDSMPYLLRSNAYNIIGEYSLAIDDCSKALEIDPDLIDAYNNRGMAYEGMGELDKAILEYSKAIEIISKDPDTYFNRELISTQKARTNKAGLSMKFISRGGLYPYDDYKDRFPNVADEFSAPWRYSDPFMNRRRVYIKTGQFDKAANNFKTIENFMMSNKFEYENDKRTAKQSKPDYILLETVAEKEFEALLRTRPYQSQDCTNCQTDDTSWISRENRRRLGY